MWSCMGLYIAMFPNHLNISWLTKNHNYVKKKSIMIWWQNFHIPVKISLHFSHVGNHMGTLMSPDSRLSPTCWKDGQNDIAYHNEMLIRYQIVRLNQLAMYALFTRSPRLKFCAIYKYFSIICVGAKYNFCLVRTLNDHILIRPGAVNHVKDIISILILCLGPARKCLWP